MDRFEEIENLRFNTPKQSLPTPFGNVDFVRMGKEGAPLMLWVPGNPDQIYAFHRLLPLLAQDFDLLAVSPPGKGYSTYSDDFDFSMASYAKFWFWLIQHFCLKNITMVGHSAGLAEILHTFFHWENSPNPIEKIISLNGWGPSIHCEKMKISREDTMIASWYGPLLVRFGSGLPIVGIKDSFHILYQRPVEKKDLDFLAEQYARPWLKGGFMNRTIPPRRAWGIVKTVRQQNQIYRKYREYYKSQETHHPKLKELPLLFITGTHDRVLSADQDVHTQNWDGIEIQYTDEKGQTYADRLYQSAEQLSQNPKNQFKRVTNSGHLTPLEAPEEVAQAIRSFS